MNPLLKILPPVWFFMFLLGGLAVHFFVPQARVFDISLPIVGIVVFIVGFALPLYASAVFSKEGTEILPTSPTNSKLVTYGPFRYTRNPMYLGMVVALFGIAIWVGSLPMFAAAVLDFCVLNFVFVPFEEAKMSRIFGGEYENYGAKVRRWI